MSTIDLKTPLSTEESGNWAYWFWEKRAAFENQLRNSGFLELRNVTCDFDDGVLTLHGLVPSYYLKQIAQSLIAESDGVLNVNNQLTVA